jgi:hypothetical protein
MVARNRVGIGLSCRPARLHRLVESIPVLLKSLTNSVSVLKFSLSTPKLRRDAGGGGLVRVNVCANCLA